MSAEMSRLTVTYTTSYLDSNAYIVKRTVTVDDNPPVETEAEIFVTAPYEDTKNFDLQDVITLAIARGSWA